MLKRDDVHMYFGLKWNPFAKNLPIEGVVVSPAVAKFCWRVENLVMDGGFGMISGQNGLGKSIAMRVLEDRLGKLAEVRVGVIQRPQSSMADFYREMGHHFGCQLNVSNRWGYFRELRAKWKAHIESTLFRPVLLVDEAQEALPAVLSELRFLSSDRFDSRNLLTVVLAGDARLGEKFTQSDLQPLGSRIYTRLVLDPLQRVDLINMMHGVLEKAGNPQLLTEEVINTLADHAVGNPRIMMNMALQLLIEAFKQQAKNIDIAIYMAAFEPVTRAGPTKAVPRRPSKLENRANNGGYPHG